MSNRGNYLVVAAIDFGTAYSGYGFSLRDAFDRDPTKISTILLKSSRCLQSSKTPTCVLFDRSKKFHSFGYKAEEKYAELAFDDKHKDWYFFKHFKMKLFDTMTVQRNLSIEDQLGKSLPAIDVFSASIGYLKDCLLKIFQDVYTGLTEFDIRWVVTVPAIWNEAAKQFMREAAKKAGITEDKLLLALEPNAASLYCRSVKVEKLIDSSVGLSHFKPGSKYLVLDAGGGTVDITVHDVKPDGTIAELYRASGGNWGGTFVDQAFLRLLSDIVGADVIKECREENMTDFLDLQMEFEMKKRSIKPEVDTKITLKCPLFLNERYKAKTGKNIKEAILSTQYSNQIIQMQDKLRIDASVVKELFTKVIDDIIQHLKMVFEEDLVRDVPTILMVGGFSESPMLQTSIRKHFPDKRIIIPEDAGLAVLKGAVIYGHNPSFITKKKTRIEQILLVAAIDFGTAYSGYGFSMRHDYDKDPTKIATIPWNSSSALQSWKTPTCALFDPNKEFYSFGFEAEDKYANLALDDEHKDWYFFQQFKMKLFNKMTVQRSFLIEDELGKRLPAIDVYSASIGYLKDQVLKTCRDRFPGTKESDILWVVTVPAIWNEGAKQFMNEAAKQAGITEKNLVLALEPEAASLYCRSMKVKKPVDASGGLSPFKPGSKYLVVDAGGGTVDITVHEVKPDGTLAELYRASGGNWGGTYVDQAFLRLLSDIVGEDVMCQCKKENMLDMLLLLREFEVKKRTFRPDMNDMVMFKVPVWLGETFKTKTGKDIKDILPSTKYSNRIRWISDKLRVDASVVKDLFTPVIDGIIQHLKKLFEEELVRDVSTILMVGGFSESLMLQTSIRKHFPDKLIIIPEDAGLAVLKGAVIYGHDPSAISERRCRYTYGFECNKSLSDMKNIKEESIPDNRKYVDREGDLRVRGVFDKHAIIGQRMETGKAQSSKGYYSVNGKAVKVRLFASTEPDPLYISDTSCTLIGSMNVDLRHLDDTSIQVSITFSHTELLVEATKEATGETLNANFRLLE